MNDKGTIVQQLEDEHKHLLEKIRLLCSEKTDIKSQLQKMQVLLERWVGSIEFIRDGGIFYAKPATFTRMQSLVDDTKTLLKEAKEVKHGN